MGCHKTYSKASAHQIHLTTQNLQSVDIITKKIHFSKKPNVMLPSLLMHRLYNIQHKNKEQFKRNGNWCLVHIAKDYTSQEGKNIFRWKTHQTFVMEWWTMLFWVKNPSTDIHTAYITNKILNSVIFFFILCKMCMEWLHSVDHVCMMECLHNSTQETLGRFAWILVQMLCIGGYPNSNFLFSYDQQ